MKGQTRVIIILLGVLVLGTASAAALLYGARNAERTERLAAEQSLQHVRREKAMVEQERDELRAKQENVAQELASLTAERDALLEKVRNDDQLIEQVRSEYDQQIAQLSTLQQHLDAERQEKAALAGRVAELESALDEAQARVAALEREAQPAAAAQAPMESVTLEPIVVQSSGGAGESGAAGMTEPSWQAATPMSEAPMTASPFGGSLSASLPDDGLQGQVLVVNRDFDFVVTNLGEDDPVQVGTVLEVYDQGRAVGKVRIERIYGAMSAATILAETDKSTLREGQIVYAL